MPHPNQELMLDVRNLALKLQSSVKNRIPSPLPRAVGGTSALPVLSFELQPSASLQAAISDPSLSSNATNLLFRRLTHSIEHYQQQYRDAARKLCQIPDTPGLDSRTRLKLLQSSLRRDFEKFQEQKIYDLLRVFKNETARPRFNHEFTPVLENFFKTNPYPSRSDRSTLAQRTNMTPKQIEVWFQNHRNRARRDGQELCKSPGLSLPQDRRESPVLEDKFSLDGLPAEAPASPKLPRLATPPPSPPDLPASPPSPSHRTLRQLLTEGRPRFSPPQWYRQPSSTAPTRDLISIEDLIIQFTSKLSLKERKTKRGTESSDDLSLDSRRCATHLVAPPAPLPSLVVSKRPCSQPLPHRRFRSRQLPRGATHLLFSPYAKVLPGNPLTLAHANRLFLATHPDPTEPRYTQSRTASRRYPHTAHRTFLSDTPPLPLISTSA